MDFFDDLVYVLALIVFPMVCCCLCSCWRTQMKMENSRRDRNTESTANITRMNTRRSVVIQLPDATTLTPEILYEDTHTDSTNSSRIARPRNYQSSVNLPPEIILIPTQHITNPESDSPPSYESLFQK